MRPNRGAGEDSAVPLKRNTGTGVIVVIFADHHVSSVQEAKIIRKAPIPVSVVHTTHVVKHMRWIVVQKIAIVFAAHMISCRMIMSNVDLSKRCTHGANISAGICIVRVIIVRVGLGSGFASEEHCQHHADSNKHKLSHYFSFVIQ